MSPAGPNSAARLPQIPREDLEIQPLTPANKPTSFAGEDRDLREFIETNEATVFDQQRLGYTYLVFLRGRADPVAYFTISCEGLRFPETEEILGRLPVRIGVVPGVKIGRLQVLDELRRRGIGTVVLNYIRTLALDLDPAARILHLDAYEDPIPFYKSFGFKTLRERGKTTLMYFDLGAQ